MKGHTFYSKNQNNTWKEFPEKTTRSTLLIPKCYMKLYFERLESFQYNRAMYLSHLLKNYRFLIRNGIIPKNSKLETAYQEEGLNLQRVDFIPIGEDWAELKCLKSFLNRSMTWIFVYLLLLDALEITKILPEKLADFVVPKISNFRVLVKIIFSRKKFFYSRILQNTRDRTG